MFSLIESKEEIAKAQHKLEAAIRRDFKTKAVKNIGYPGGTTFDAKVVTDGSYWYWSSDYDVKDIPNPRRLNWFGLFRDDADLQISVEINTAYEGRNDQVAGFFARDNDTGSIYLLHSGRVGGGTKGVGKAAFLAWSNQRPIDVVDSYGGIREGVLVMPIEGVAASRSAVRYIDVIASFKQAVRAGDLNSPEFQSKKKELDDFFSESRGRRKGKRSGEIDYLSRHGEVVDALYSWRNSSQLPKGGRLVKNVLIDMGVAVANELVEVFEVKTSTARSDVYTAIGQLMVHGTSDECRRVIVLPKSELLASDLKEALERLNIELLKFKLDEKAATIV
ncbi:hypothetical protein [Methylobacter sp.]|uniref:hypothetical protein n=1 Tax=Methylobacter sp. TaxID=2051955 RepID=UPI00248A5408|nr:hypothetical protein [Methylobacter sp.]MDI1279256.1 hypothetical protein [Methylobacter sp.]MDI1360021.1 hypothetical protein [Methylobacter sp.]